MATVDLLTGIYSSHAVYLERVAASLGNDALPYLESIENRVTKVLDKMPKRALSTQETKDIRNQIDLIVREELQAYTDYYKDSNKEVGIQQAAFDVKTLDDVTENYEPSAPSAAAINSLAVKTPIKIGDNQFTTYNRYVASYWKSYTAMINDSVAAGFITGGTNREIAANILEAITLDRPDGDLSKAQRAAKTMARTGTNHYSTQATVAFVDKNDEVLTGYRFIATLDGRTSRECSALDQRVFKKDDPNIPFPALHPNCRSRITYEVDGRYTYDDSASTRPSNFRDADGKREPKRVSSKEIYYQELKGMSAADRNAILGAQLGQALSKMNSEQFAKSLIDSTYNPLTIAEMKKKDNELGKILRNQSKS